jgi:hypothetical protein
MNAIILKGAALRFHKLAPEPKQLPTPGLGGPRNDYINMNDKDIGWEGVDWIRLA